MFLIEWMFDKMGYQKKVDWTSVFATWDTTKPVKAKPRKPAAKKAVKPRVRKKV